jgi:hypothetical protein
MDDETKQGFENLEKRIAIRIESQDNTVSVLEKRFDDIKWYFGGAATLFTLVFAVLSVVLAMKYDSEVDGLRQFKTELREDTGRSTAQPDVELLAPNGAQSSGQDVIAKAEMNIDGNSYLHFSQVLRNKGEGETGDIWLKLYTREPLRQRQISTDEPTFEFQGVIEPENLHPKSLPGKYSNQYFLNYKMNFDRPPPAGRYPALIRAYYGKGKSIQASITLVIEGATEPQGK